MKYLMVMLVTALVFHVTGAAQDSKSNQAKKSETVTIAVESIQCGSCKRAVEKALKEVDGVEEARVDFKTKQATVTYLPTKTNLSELETAITKAGYSANDKKADPEAYENLDDCCKLPQE